MMAQRDRVEGRSIHIPVGVPAKAGTHLSTARTADGWVPAFAGTPVLMGAAIEQLRPARQRNRRGAAIIG